MHFDFSHNNPIFVFSAPKKAQILIQTKVTFLQNNKSRSWSANTCNDSGADPEHSAISMQSM